MTDRRTFLALCGGAALAGCTSSPDGGQEPKTTGETSPTTTATERTTQTTMERRAMAGSWSTFGYDTSNCGYNSESPAVPKTEKSWSHAVPGYYTLPTPAVSEIGVYMCSKASVFGIDRATGLGVWEARLAPYTHTFTPAVADGTVYGVARGLAGADSGSNRPGVVVAIDERTGDRVWEQRAMVTSSPTVGPDRLFHAAAGRTGASIVGRSKEDGTVAWERPLNGGDRAGAFGTPALVDGALYATGWIRTTDGSDGVLYSLDPASGEERWRVTVSETVESAPLVDGQLAVIAGTDGTLYAIDTDARSVIWSTTVGDGIYARPAMGPDHVFAVTEGTLTALDRATGEVQWTGSVGESHFSEIAVAGGAVYVGGDTLYSYRTADGTRRWKKPVPGAAGAWGGPAVVNGDIYVGVCIKSDAGSLYDNYVYWFDG